MCSATRVGQILGRVDQSGASDSSGTYWDLSDHLGSVRDVINNGGTLKDSIAYDGYGNIIGTELNYLDRGMYAWTGQQLDVQTGLQYNRARWYDSESGRWMSQDPMGFDAGDSNLYRYVNNRPTSATDPSGLRRRRFGAWQQYEICPTPIAPCPSSEVPKSYMPYADEELPGIRTSQYPPQLEPPQKSGQPVSRMYVFAIDGFGGRTSPVIGIDPLSQNRILGNAITKSAAAGGTTPEYDWSGWNSLTVEGRIRDTIKQIRTDGECGSCIVLVGYSWAQQVLQR